MGGAFGLGGMGRQAGTYEFSPAENVTIGKLGGRSRTWGMISIGLGGLVVVVGVGVMVFMGANAMALGVGGAALAFGLQPVVSGVFYLRAGSAFRLVVDSHGSDVPHMMDAIRKLTVAVKVEAIVAIVAVFIGVAVGIAVASAR